MDKLKPEHQLLIAAAWVDTMLEQREVAVLRRLLGRVLSPGELNGVLALDPPSVEEVLASMPGSDPPEQIMRQVLQVCFADDNLEVEEYELIQRVARVLRISDERLETLRREQTAS